MLNIEMKSKVALIGGSFDPIHIGHINLFHNVYSLAHFDRLIVVPTFLSNFKQDSKPATFSHRVNMIKLAIADYKDLFPCDRLDIEISLFEGDMKGISYTSETIKHFFSSFEDNGKVNFIIGDDILPDLDKWHDFEYIRKSVRFFCFSRAGERSDYGVEVHFIPSPVTIASSTSIRGGDKSMLSQRVREYIDEHSLY